VITRVHTLSYESMRSRATELARDPATAIVSILDTHTPATLCGSAARIFADDTPRIVTVAFDEKDGPRTRCINSQQAHQIVVVIAHAHRRPREVTLWVNCSLGVARSGGVALFAADYCAIPSDVFSHDVPLARQKLADRFVYESLVRAALQREQQPHV
jgi:predicted protein tyrosine phosphatase